MITQRSTLTNLITLYLTSLLLADADEEKEKDEEVEDEEPSKSDEGISEEPEIDWTQVELSDDELDSDLVDDDYENYPEVHDYIPEEFPEVDGAQDNERVELANADDEDTYEFMFEEEDDEEESADSTTEVSGENYKPDTNLADKNAEWEAERGSDDEYPFTTYNEDPLKELREYVERDETEDKEENSEDGPQ